MIGKINTLSDLGISKPDFNKIEQEFRNKFNPTREKIITADDFYDYLNNQLFVMGLNDFKEFITTEKEKSKAQLTKHFGNTLGSYVLGIDFRIYSIILERIESNNKDLYNIPFIGELFSKHLTISEKIKDAYCSLVPQPSESENVPQYYVGKLNHYNQPYRVQVYGAYPLMKYWEMIVYKMENANDEAGYFKQWEKKKVFEAMKEYAKGFQQGYNDFLKDIIDNKDNLSNSEAIRFQKIKDYVFNYWNNAPGFSETNDTENIFSHWFEDGKKGGYYYRAWYLILDNHLAFAPLFETKHREGNKENINAIDPLDLIVIELRDYFTKVEGKAISDGNPDSKIRLAAFLEMMFEKKYFIEKNRIKACNDYSKTKFGMDIAVSLNATNAAKRYGHVNHVIKGKPPLKTFL